MNTIHLFDDSNNANDNRLGDLEKTIIINSLMEVPFEERDEEWRDIFLANIAECTLKLAETEVVVGPDGFPYFSTRKCSEGSELSGFCH
jgi:GTP-sensing pleiotropic transcriptional regulator CodY